MSIALVAASASAATAQSLTLTNGPTTGQTTILPAKDYASYAWQDAWDMDKRTDIGWLTWGVDQPGNQMVSKQMTSCTSGITGCQTFQFLPTENAQPLFFLLDTWQPGAAPLGKLGVRKPIQTSQFKYLLIKMRMQNAVSSGSYGSVGGPPQFVVYWSRDTIYRVNGDGSPRPNGGILRSLTNNGTNPGILLDGDGVEANQWQIYAVDLTTLQWWNQSKNPGGIVVEPSSTAWGQSGVTADSFFVQPVNWKGSLTGNMEIDWVQLSETPGPSGAQLIKWSGGNATYDIVISPSSNCVGSNANAPDYAVVAEGVSRTNGLTFPFGTLPAGSYYVGLRVSGNDGPGITRGAIALCSAGSYVVPGQSSLQFLTPTDEGSSDDFASVFLNNAWDFDSLSDVDFSVNLVNPAIDNAFPAQRPEGNNLGQVRVFRTGAANADPYIYPLYYHGRGQNVRIDPHRYRIFTMDIGIDADRDINAGSVARLYWHVSGDQNGQGIFLENSSEDLLVRHLRASSNGGQFVLDHIRGDLLNMGSLPIESENNAPSRSGWTSSCISPWCGTPSSTPGIDSFRIDFDEFSSAPTAYVRNARLASLERTGTNYTISWTTTTPNISGATASVKLYANPAVIQAASPTGTRRDPADPTCNPSNNALKLLNGNQGTALTLGANQAGQFSWNPQQTNGVTAYNGTDGSGEYYICAVVTLTAGSQSMTSATTLTQFPILVDPSFTDLPEMYLSPSIVRLTAVYDRPTNSFVYASPDQTVTITQVGSGSPTWALTLRHPDGSIPQYLRLSRTSGTGPGTFTVGFNPSGLTAPPLPDCTPQDGLTSILTLGTGGTTSNDPQTMQVAVTIKPSANTTCSNMPTNPTTPAFGSFDAPASSQTYTGAVGVSGWALDDLTVSRLEIYRNCAGTIDTSRGACVAARPGEAADKVFVGFGNFVPGARPDVQNMFPNYPNSDRAGWGYLLLTLGFPDLVNNKTTGGQGTYSLFAYAIDVEGNRTLLGQKSIVLDNLHATLPFGTIDTPTEGGTVPGTGSFSNPNAYPNFGWALTQAGKCIDINDTNAYQVFIDGVRRTTVRNTNWFPGINRQDVATSFPGLCNSNTAVAYYLIDVGALSLANGMHTIGWTVTDNAGKAAGIGSRFFNVNVGGGAAASANLQSIDLGGSGSEVGAPPDVFAQARPLARAGRMTKGSAGERALETDANGLAHIHTTAIDRVQIDLPDGGQSPWQAYTVERGRLWVMPIGATFEPDLGRLSWQPVPGFLGDFDFLFVRRGADGATERMAVRVTIGSGTAPGNSGGALIRR